MNLKSKPLTFQATKTAGNVRALLMKSRNASCLLLFAHGAGADMKPRFMESMAQELAIVGIAMLLRYQFPYTQRQSGRPEPILGRLNIHLGFEILGLQ